MEKSNRMYILHVHTRAKKFKTLAVNAKLAVGAPLALNFFYANNSPADSGVSVRDKCDDVLQPLRNPTSTQQHRNKWSKYKRFTALNVNTGKDAARRRTPPCLKSVAALWMWFFRLCWFDFLLYETPNTTITGLGLWISKKVYLWARIRQFPRTEVIVLSSFRLHSTKKQQSKLYI